MDFLLARGVDVVEVEGELLAGLGREADVELVAVGLLQVGGRVADLLPGEAGIAKSGADRVAVGGVLVGRERRRRERDEVGRLLTWLQYS